MCRTSVVRSIGEQVASILPSWPRRGARGVARSEAAEARLAAVALLLEIAYADGEYTEEERLVVEATVRDQYGLDTCAARQLVERADEARSGSAQVWHFTRAVQAYSEPQKALLARYMHTLADFDGAANTQEVYAVRKISTLMRVEPAYAGV